MRTTQYLVCTTWFLYNYLPLPWTENKKGGYLPTIFSSPEPKAQVSFSDRNLSVVRRRLRCHRRRRCRFHVFFFFSRTIERILTKSRTNCPWVKGNWVRSNEGPRPFSRRDNYKKVKTYWRNLKIFFSRTTGPISTKIKLGTEHPWFK